MDGITVHYFKGLNGRGALIKCMLEVSKTPYTAKNYEFPEWGSMEKPVETFEYCQLPVVEMNGKVYNQSLACELLLGKKLGFAGDNDDETYEVTNIIAGKEDWIFKIYPVLFNVDQTKLEQNFEEINKDLLSYILPIYERKVTIKKGKYVVNNKITLADIFLTYTYLLLTQSGFKGKLNDSLNKYAPNFCSYCKGLATNELKDYFETGSYVKDAVL